jgi:hypothetical protein
LSSLARAWAMPSAGRYLVYELSFRRAGCGRLYVGTTCPVTSQTAAAAMAGRLEWHKDRLA